jgi:protein TonB
MSATINTFPPFQSMNSPRGWILAVIVLLHFGFFLLLSSGMGHRIVEAFRPPTIVVELPRQREREPDPQPIDHRIDFTPTTFPIPLQPPILPNVDTDEPPISLPPRDPRPAGEGVSGESVRTPVIVQPEIDPRIGLSEPPYPASEIRAGRTGTVLLSVFVLENGRVGDVRLDQTSGSKRLDESAMKEARHWRLKPGMRDGMPMAMWKQVPITFQLTER